MNKPQTQIPTGIETQFQVIFHAMKICSIKDKSTVDEMDMNTYTIEEKSVMHNKKITKREVL